MKTILFISILAIISNLFYTVSFAQTPQSIKYQAIVRDTTGHVIPNQPVTFQISIISGSPSGVIVYIETHSTTTNSYGLVNLSVGNGIIVAGVFSAIDWGNGVFFMKVELDQTGGTSYADMGTTQLLSVPYALYSEKAGAITDSLWGRVNDNIYNINQQNVGIGTSSPVGKLEVKQSLSASDTLPLFEVKDKSGQTVFVVYPDSAHFFVKDASSKANKGSFAVSGRNSTKAVTNDFLWITPDSTRIYTSDTVSGFGVKNIDSSSKISYMNLSPKNYFIGHESGMSNSLGLYNSFMGYQAGRSNTVGMRNAFIGYQAGYSNLSGNDNTAFGDSALYSNISGSGNTATGVNALNFNTTGNNNTATGNWALCKNTEGVNNTANGTTSLSLNTTGYQNTASGWNTLYNNSIGHHNTASGANSLFTNTEGHHNTANGSWSLYNNTIGFQNTACGSGALWQNTDGSNNSALGVGSLYVNTTGSFNTAVGVNANNSNISGVFKTAIGSQTLTSDSTGSYLTVIGSFADVDANGYSNSTALGALTNITASDQVRIGSNYVMSIGGFADWTNVSDGRFKKNISDNVPGLTFIMKLRPVTYHLDMEKIAELMQTPDSLRLLETEKIKGAILQTGFIAQEVEKAANEAGFDFSGVDKPRNENDFYGLRYAEFTVPLVKAIQEQQTLIIEQQSVIDELVKNIQLLEKRIISLEKK